VNTPIEDRLDLPLILSKHGEVKFDVKKYLLSIRVFFKFEMVIRKINFERTELAIV